MILKGGLIQISNGNYSEERPYLDIVNEAFIVVIEHTYLEVEDQRDYITL